MTKENREPMMSIAEVTSRYNKMIDLDSHKNMVHKKINCYACNCGNIIKTVDIDAGTTPMFISCNRFVIPKFRNKNFVPPDGYPACGGMAKSTFYNDIAPDKPITIEWYRPSLEETIKRRRRKGGDLEHILNGGLEMRLHNPIVK